MATSTSKKDSRDSALNVHKFYGHQRHIDRSLHPVNQSVENFNDRDHRQIDGDHLAAVHSDRTGCLDIGEPDLSVQVDTDHTDDVVNGDHFSMVHIYRNAVECLNNFSNPQGGFCFSTPTDYPQQFSGCTPSTNQGGFCFSLLTGYPRHSLAANGGYLEQLSCKNMSTYNGIYCPTVANDAAVQPFCLSCSLVHCVWRYIKTNTTRKEFVFFSDNIVEAKIKIGQ